MAHGSWRWVGAREGAKMPHPWAGRLGEPSRTPKRASRPAPPRATLGQRLMPAAAWVDHPPPPALAVAVTVVVVMEARMGRGLTALISTGLPARPGMAPSAWWKSWIISTRKSCGRVKGACR